MDNKEEKIEEIKEVLQKCKLEEDLNYKINKNKDKMSESFKAYILSFIPYFIMLFFGGSKVGGFTFFGEYSTLYGWDAMMWRLIFFYSPIFLGLFIFQLIYTIIKYKTFTKKEKTISKIIIILLIVTILVFYYSDIYNNLYG